MNSNQTNVTQTEKETTGINFLDVLSASKAEFVQIKQISQTSDSSKAITSIQTGDNSTEDNTTPKVSQDIKLKPKDSSTANRAAGKALQTDEIEEEPNLSQETNELITTIQEAILQLITQQTGTSNAEVTEAMEELNLNFTDLQEPGKLASLVTSLTGTGDTVELLTSDEFQSLIGQMDQLWDNVSTIYPQENLEQLKMLVDTIALTEQPVQEQMISDIEESLVTPAQEENVEQPSNRNQDIVIENVMLQDETASPQVNSQLNQKQTEPLEEGKAVDENEGQAKVTVTTVEEQTISTTADNQETSSGQEEQEASTKDDSLSKLLKENEKTTNETSDHISAIPQTITTQQTVMTPEGIQQVDMQSIIDQISELTKTTTSGTVSSIQMQLNPEHLGKLFIEVSSSQGEITAKIAAQNEAVKQTLESQAVELKATLEQQGVKVAAVEVTVESHGFERNLDQNETEKQMQENQQNQQNQSKERRRNLNLQEMTLNDLSGMMTEEEALMANMMADNGGTLDLNA